MAWIESIEPSEAKGRLADVYEQVASRRGQIANIYQVHSLHPEALQAHLDLYMSLLYRREGLSRAQRESIAVLVSALNACGYCVLHHAEALGHHERSESVLRRLQAADPDAPASAPDRAMLAYARKLTRDPASVGPSDVESLRRSGFSDAEILDIALITSYFNFVNRVVSGLGVAIEDEADRDYRY